MSTSKKLWIGFGTLIAILMVVGSAIILRLQLVEQRVRTQADVSRPRTTITQKLETTVIRAGTSLRYFAFTRDREQKEAANQSISEVDRRLAEYLRIANSEKQRE